RLGRLLAVLDVTAQADPAALAEPALLEPEKHLRPAGGGPADEAQARPGHHPGQPSAARPGPAPAQPARRVPYSSPRASPISRSSTPPWLTRSPSCSYSLVTQGRSPAIAPAVRSENSVGTYMSL